MKLADSDLNKNVDLSIWSEYQRVLDEVNQNQSVKIETISRFDFYERAKKAYAIVHSG